MDLNELKANRFRFLKCVYDLSGGDKFRWVAMHEVGRDLGFDRGLTERIGQYLKDEHLIDYHALGPVIGITHYGIQEIERALSEPDEPTNYFPPINNFVSIGQMVNSSIQQAGPGSIQVVHGVDLRSAARELAEEVRRCIEELALDQSDRDDVMAQVETIEAQLSSPRAKTVILAECLSTIRNVLEGTTGSLIAAAIAAKIVALLGG